MIDPSRIVGSDDMGMIESLVVVVTLILKACLSLLHARDHGSKRNQDSGSPQKLWKTTFKHPTLSIGSEIYVRGTSWGKDSKCSVREGAVTVLEAGKH